MITFNKASNNKTDERDVYGSMKRHLNQQDLFLLFHNKNNIIIYICINALKT